MILDLINGAALIAYMVCLAVGLYYDRRTAPRRHVERAVSVFMLAALAAFVAGGAALMRVDENGWVLVGLAAFFLASSIVVVTLTVARADRMEAGR